MTTDSIKIYMIFSTFFFFLENTKFENQIYFAGIDSE